MKLKELIENRYSVRAYLPQPVEPGKINYILECARLSPSAANYQPWKFYVVTENSVVEKIKEAYNREWVKSAPMFIVVCKDTAVSWKRTASDNKDYSDVDAAIAAEHICLAAADIGLGTCWVCNFDPTLVAKALNLSQNEEPVVVFPLGYIDKEKSSAPVKKRNSLSDITTWI